VWVARLNGVSVIRFDQSLIVVVVVIIRCRCFITTRWAYTRVLCDRRRRRRRTVTGRCPSGPDDRRYTGESIWMLYIILCLNLPFNLSLVTALGRERGPLMWIAEGVLRVLTYLYIALHKSDYVHVIYNVYYSRVAMCVQRLLF